MKNLYKNENNNIFTFTLLLVVAILVLSLCFINNDLVFAEDTDTILNFNQYVYDSTTNYTYTVAANSFANLSDWYQSVFNTSSVTLTSGHIVYYFIDFDITDGAYLQVYNNSNVVSSAISTSGRTTISSSGYTFLRLVNTTSSSLAVTCTINNFNIIDLTQMYGSGNEPTADECAAIFTAEYYRYTTGTPINTTQLQYQSGYEQGYSDGYNSFTTQPIFTNGLDNVTNGTSYFENTINSYYNSDGSITYTNVGEVYISLLLDEDLEYSYRYNVSWDNITCSEDGTLDFEYVLEDGSYSTLSDSFTTGESGSFTFYYNESSTTNTFLYFVITLNDASSDDITFTILNLKITKETDLTTTYSTGYRDGESKGYSNGYTNGYNKGYSTGFNECYNRSSTNVVLSFWSWFTNMFENLGNVFDIELYNGITIGSVLLVPLLFSILMLVLKLIRG